MPRRHLLATPALLIMGVYVVALVAAAVIALTTGNLGVLWWLTVFTERDRSVVTWPNVLVLVLAGLPWAWALWQILRGPLAGPSPELDQDTRRLRIALYAAATSWLLGAVLPYWPWWAVVLDAGVMWLVVTLFASVLGPNLEFAEHARGAGVLAYGGFGAVEVLNVLEWPVPGWLELICGVAFLIWTVLLLRAQRRDRRWQRDTVWYGIAALVSPFAVGLVGALLWSETNVYDDALAAVAVLTLVWLARSAHDLANPRPQPGPLSPAL
ncbi:hypothetical protein ACQP2T_18090 [Nonomuraea sp. CA-143628]|uniref:hypothetical protein n=1 Tax=Nonomuraea sp. CA-143628 TaxID=3239997 RepID=UPI003D8D68BC